MQMPTEAQIRNNEKLKLLAPALLVSLIKLKPVIFSNTDSKFWKEHGNTIAEAYSLVQILVKDITNQ